jgi:hypothetical protein
MLAIQTLINVTTSLSQTAGAAQTTNTMLALTNNTVIDLVVRILPFGSVAAVAAYFGLNGPEYAAAVAFFAQSPQPAGPLYIGRWAQAAAAGQVIGSALTPAQQAIANFSGIANAGFTVDLGAIVAVAAPTIVPSAAAINTTATYTLAQSTDTLSGTLKLQVTGSAAFTVTIPLGTTLGAAVTLLNLNTAFATTNSLTASTAGATLIVTGAVGTGGSKTLIDNASTLLDAPVTQNVTGVVLTGVANLPAVASAINLVLTGATVAWDPIFGRFIVTSTATGASSAVSFLSPPSAGPTDISGLLGLTSTAGGYESPGQAAESALAAVTLFDAQFGGKWYALVMPTISANNDHVAVADYVQSSQTKHFYGVTTSDPNVLVPTATSDIAYVLSQANVNKTAVQFSSTSSVAVVSPLARILTVNYSGASTAINLMWQNCPTLIPENLNSIQFAALQAKNCNVFAEINNGTSIFLTGTTCSTDVFIDTVIGADNLAIDMTTALFNTFLNAGTKIPQTDGGMHILADTCTGVCVQYATNDYLGAGTWTSAPIPPVLATGDYMENGFIVYAAPLASQPVAQRASRMAGPIQIAAKLSGAINTANVAVTINP